MSRALTHTEIKLPAKPVPPRAGDATRRSSSVLREMRGPIVAGGLVIALCFGGVGGWAAVAKLASAVIAPGVVSPDGSRRTVQHLEGGIIRRLPVRDGSEVSAGEVLIELEEVQARASNDVLETRFATLAATQARLLAEQARVDTIRFPDWLLEAARSKPAAREAIAAQTRLFATRAQALADRKAILGRRIAQLREEIAGFEAQIRADTRQIELIDEETDGVDQLYKRGLERKTRLLALHRARTDIEGDRAERLARIARVEQAIGETELQIIAEETALLDETNTQLIEAQAELAEVEQRLAASRDVLERTLIRAPIDGTVVQLRFRTPGGVIRPGEPILDIVPKDEELLIDVQVSPLDIDVVHAGLPAQVMLPAFKQRNMPRLDGRIRQVSADVITDQRTNQSFFRARVEVDRQELAALVPQIELTPGMPAEVFIMTGEQTALNYMLRPFLDSVRRALREG